MHDDNYYSNSPILPGKYFRLRVSNGIVGYMRETKTDHLSYSPDFRVWQSIPIEYEHKDRSSGILDSNRKMIFEYDIVRMKKTDTMLFTPRGWVVWDILAEKMCINILEENRIIDFPSYPPNAPFTDSLRVISQLYNTEDDGLI